MTIIGDIDNGKVVPVSIGDFEGMAVLRERPGKIEVAFVGPRPSRNSLTGVVDGLEATLTAMPAGHASIALFDVVYLPRV